jgi:hypothetical protein
MIKRRDPEVYRGFEQGPIRPPSEAGSLLIRVTRNCPWNRCTFCPVYKGADFSLRPIDEVLEDIRRVHYYVMAIRECGLSRGKVYAEDIQRLLSDGEVDDRAALNAALNWASSGMTAIFLQDANSLVIRPDRLLKILRRLQQCFPWVSRVTSYARSHTIARISDENLSLMNSAGLSRIHIGMESGSDKVLAKIKKGVDKKTQIEAGIKVKKAGMELSEYLMPGLGGKELSHEHAVESADALNQINPDFIRLRTLAIPDHVELSRELNAGRFVKLGDFDTVRELHTFISHLEGITSSLKSDHILNLFENLEGSFPGDKDKLLNILDDFLALSSQQQMIYQVGRRMGLFRSLGDMDDTGKRQHVQKTCDKSGITVENVDTAVDELLKRFI